MLLYVEQKARTLPWGACNLELGSPNFLTRWLHQISGTVSRVGKKYKLHQVFLGKPGSDVFRPLKDTLNSGEAVYIIWTWLQHSFSWMSQRLSGNQKLTASQIKVHYGLHLTPRHGYGEPRSRKTQGRQQWKKGGKWQHDMQVKNMWIFQLHVLKLSYCKEREKRHCFKSFIEVFIIIIYISQVK